MPTDCIGAELLRNKTAELITAEKTARDALNAILDDLTEKLKRDLCCVKLPTITGHLWWKKLAYKPVKIEKKFACIKIAYNNVFAHNDSLLYTNEEEHGKCRILVIPEGDMFKITSWYVADIEVKTYEEVLNIVIFYLSQYAQKFASEYRKYLK